MLKFEHLLDQVKNEQQLDVFAEGKWIQVIKLGGSEESFPYQLLCGALRRRYAKSTAGWTFDGNEHILFHQLCQQFGIEYECKSSWKNEGKATRFTCVYVFSPVKKAVDKSQRAKMIAEIGHRVVKEVSERSKSLGNENSDGEFEIEFEFDIAI